MLSLFVLAPLLALFPLNSLAVLCYFPNGGGSGADVPCNADASVSACCFTGQACLSNGLCVSDPHNESIAAYHRGTCTDSTWQSSGCPKHCLDITNNGVPVFSCNQTNTDEYCCYDNCQCSSQYEVFSFSSAEPYTLTIIGEDYTNTHVSTTASATSTGTNTAASTSASSTSSGSSVSRSGATATSSPTSSSDSSNSSNTTAIGVGVGVGIGGVLLIAAAAIWFWRRKSRNNSYRQTYNINEAPNNQIGYQHNAQKFAQYQQSPGMASPGVASELPAHDSYDPIELDATRGRK